ncbi:circularly permuted type 2 ATP-grasp protein [Ramlibacter sp. WS9]|uniref:circularly permuted type 2 ATP-grasp protein n=1 Tax=Ramlibacter sp. WS9 TaxID=1882741 RepID=UPI001143611A|nr:circularly permuted type 2 ATP-grasp protein [Ramlibacter sp. WS9]ROZ76988.1 hypothetical protein EEB15_10385 [Ramlibacter sp. WS9]
MNMAEALNLGCVCRTLDSGLLRDQLESRPALRGLADDVASGRPNLFSATPVFISARDHALLEGSVAALHRASTLPGFRAAAMERAPAIAALGFGPQGVFMGYDFHISEAGPRLIEINTNAGGALLHAAAARAHRACCEPKGEMFSFPFDLDTLDANWIAMFHAEWNAQRGGTPLRSIAIVDDAPSQQYLAPEFRMARELFLAHGIQAVVADPGELQWRGGRLWHSGLPAGMPVDMVYNRLTDFDFSASSHAGLRDAYTSGAAVVTPHPRAHALHADKRNLVELGNGELLASWGVSCEDRELLAATVPAASLVTAENADMLWARRRQLFFKPAGGYGSKGAYRGDKLTRRVWSEIVAGGYIAQALVAPSERMVDVGGEATRLKLDVRAYAYAGRIQLLAARTYSGQTTNFRTPGGGFSPVVVLPSNSTPQACC